MAFRLANSTQSVSSNTTITATNTPTLHATTNITISTTDLYTAAFTAGNIGDTAQGIALYIKAVGSGGTVTVTLQDNAAGWADVVPACTASITTTSLTANNWNYFQVGTPYAFTATTASFYRWKVVNASAAGTTSGAADSGGSNLHYYSFDNRTGALGATDDLAVASQNAGAASVLILDGTVTLGSGTTTALVAARQIGNAMSAWAGGTFKIDTASSVAYTVKGNMQIGNGGQFLGARTGLHYPISQSAVFNFDEGTTSGNYGIGIFDGAIFKTYGALQSSINYWKTTLASGTGTAADPAIMADDVNWRVGDRICIGPDDDSATNYNNTEYRYIITKNSATSYVWSLTAGGAEAALVNAHGTDSVVLNLTRNIVFQTTAPTTRALYLLNYNTTAGNVVLSWTGFNGVGSGAKSYVAGIYINIMAGTTGLAEYCVITNQLYNGFIFRGSNIAETITGCISADSGNITSSSGAYYFSSAGKKTLTDCFAIDIDRSALSLENAKSLTFNNFKAIAVNIDGGSSAGGFYVINASKIVFNSSEFHCSKIMLSLGISLMTFNNCLVGTKGLNLTDIYCTTDSYVNCLFDNCTFGHTAGDANFISNYLNMADGSELAFDNLDTTANRHYWYTNGGFGRATGAGLDDTTVRTAGTLNVGLCSETSDGQFWEFQVLARPSTYVQVGGFAYGNGDFASDVNATLTVELYLPGSLTPNSVQEMTITSDSANNDAVFSVQAYYSGAVNRYATVRITAVSLTAGACAYVADIFNGTNNITNLLTWRNGKPSTIMFEQLGDAQAVWQVANSTLTTLGTTGYNQASTKILNGRATAGGDTYINIAANSSTTDQCYYENILTIISGPGAGQSRIIVDYDGVTKKAVVDREWQVNPTSDSFYTVTPFSGIFLANAGRCPLAGGSTYIYLNSFASSLDNSYVDSSVYISAGTGAGQIRLITDYDGMTKAADVNTAWSVNPDSTSVYKIIPAGNTVTGSLTASALEQIKSGVLATQLTRGGSYDFTDSLAQRMIDTDIKTDEMNVEQKNLPAYLLNMK